jgi:glycosyltransferase involved in cell wall biosynthesis
MNKALTLSIIIPVYNESDHIASCLDSIQKQSVKPTEVIVVDNNSTDDSVKIAKKYDFVKIIREPKQGIVYARNAGFDASMSDILARIDSDSRLPKDWVERILDFYQDSEHFKNYAWTSDAYWYNASNPIIYSWFSSQIVFRFNRFILGHYPLWGSSMAISNVSWKKVKNKVCLRNDIHEDLDLSIHLHRLGYQITYATGVQMKVYIRRLYTDYGKLWGYLQLWPKTLRVHNLKRWYFGQIGAIIVYSGSPILKLQARLIDIVTNKKNLQNTRR